MHFIIVKSISAYNASSFQPGAKNAPVIVSMTQESGLKENTVMIGGIDPEPCCWNSKSLPELNGSKPLFFL